MKKFLAIALTSSFLFTGVVHAQTSTLPDLSTMSLSQLQDLYSSLLKQLIALLQQKMLVLQQNNQVDDSIVNQEQNTQVATDSNTGSTSINIYATPDSTVTVDGVQYSSASSVPVKPSCVYANACETNMTITKNPEFSGETLDLGAIIKENWQGWRNVRIASFLLVNNTAEDADVTRLAFMPSADVNRQFRLTENVHATVNGIAGYNVSPIEGVRTGDGYSLSIDTLVVPKKRKAIPNMVKSGQTATVDIYVSILLTKKDGSKIATGVYASPFAFNIDQSKGLQVSGQDLTVINSTQ